MSTPVPPPAAPPAPAPPPPVPPSPDELTVRSTLDLGRTLALLVALVAGLLFLLLLVLSVVGAIFGTGFTAFVGAGYCFVSAVVNYLLWREIPSTSALVAQHQFGVARDRLIVWMVLGFLFFVIEGVVLLIAWIKLDSMAHAGGGLPATIAGAPVCPRCGGPLTFVPEYQRNYCYRCAAYA
jgi:hypothetical protein